MQQKLCQQRELEIEHLLRSRSSLESSLKLSKQERDRQHDQIMKLTEVKLNLTEDREKMQEAAHQSKEDANYKIIEVVNLKKENVALRDEIQASREQMETRDATVSITDMSSYLLITKSYYLPIRFYAWLNVGSVL